MNSEQEKKYAPFLEKIASVCYDLNKTLVLLGKTKLTDDDIEHDIVAACEFSIHRLSEIKAMFDREKK